MDRNRPAFGGSVKDAFLEIRKHQIRRFFDPYGQFHGSGGGRKENKNEAGDDKGSWQSV